MDRVGAKVLDIFIGIYYNSSFIKRYYQRLVFVILA